ncbi:hypothetical protein YSA_05259 [Pseudomonas putida ND6]|uniref:Uncharacterized protein n=1 Tax=Pseudomonas putida ND6 TaxID=231023 RepID=I3UVU4_PSEPU|nr:hypothetical protein YSA_05259 [Pseudomonas putida ND6]
MGNVRQVALQSITQGSTMAATFGYILHHLPLVTFASAKAG